MYLVAHTVISSCLADLSESEEPVFVGVSEVFRCFLILLSVSVSLDMLFTVITGNVNIVHENRITLSLLKVNRVFKRHLNNIIDNIL